MTEVLNDTEFDYLFWVSGKSSFQGTFLASSKSSEPVYGDTNWRSVSPSFGREDRLVKESECSSKPVKNLIF